MRSFHNKQSIKTKYLKRVIAHQKADEIIKGTYWQNGKGCAVGCTIHGSKHANYEKELGIPEWLAVLEDKIFEGLPSKRAKKWPVENHKKGSRVTVYGAALSLVNAARSAANVAWSISSAQRSSLSSIRSAIRSAAWCAEAVAVNTEYAVDNAVRAAWIAACGSTGSAVERTVSVLYIKYADKLLKLLKEE